MMENQQDTEVRNLRTRLQELYGINLKLNEALKLSNEKIINLYSNKTTDSDIMDINQLLTIGSIKRSKTTYRKGNQPINLIQNDIKEKGNLIPDKEEGIKTLPRSEDDAYNMNKKKNKII